MIDNAQLSHNLPRPIIWYRYVIVCRNILNGDKKYDMLL